MRVVAVLAVCALAAGCAARAPALRSVIEGAPPELAATPFFPDDALYCGPAALATVLQDSGIDGVTPERLQPLLFTPGRSGTLQAELLAQARAHGRVPVLLEGRMQAIADALAEGLPVLVLQNLHTPGAPAWHYAVVVALDPGRNRVVLRSGVEQRRVESAADFMRSWSLAGRWAVVAVPPARVPRFARPEQWLSAAAPAESTGAAELALRAYIAATHRWPEYALSWAAVGNAHHALDNIPAARRAWQHALELDPDFEPARHNLESS